MYPEYTLNRPNGVDYCVVIDNKIKYNDVLQREFKEKQDIRIVISVDMMDTGVDIPEVVNLVFFKRILSKIKFWQMIGRGTRLCKNLDTISPSKAYFERFTNDGSRVHYADKQGFLIFDVCNVFSFFKQNPDGKVDSSEAEMSINQKIFFQKVKLIKALQVKFNTLGQEDKDYYTLLLKDVIKTIQTLNRNRIGVQSNLQYVEKYSELSAWQQFDQNKLVEVKTHLARLIDGEVDLPSLKVFDYLCYKFSETKFTDEKEHKKTAKSLYAIAKYLLDAKLHIEEVRQQEKTLTAVVTEEFLNHATASAVDKVRQDVRALTRYIEKDVLAPIITDFDDNISSKNDADDDKPFAGSIKIDEFKSLAEKVQSFIVLHLGHPFIQQIKTLSKPTKDALANFRKEISELAKSHEEYSELFKSDKDLVNFVRKNVGIDTLAMDKFIKKELDSGFNTQQLAFVRALLIFISENGRFEKSDLLREELDFRKMFNSIEISKLISDIEEVL
jgi:type I restriction enzyme R subunit